MSVDEYFLRQASIFELRNIARDMGVLSPTIYKKDELVSRILKIQSGEEKPQMPKSKQGRPPKSVFAKTISPLVPTERFLSYKDIVLSYEPEQQLNFNKTSNDFFGVLSSSDFDYSETPFSTEKVYKGYFIMVDNEYGFVFNIDGLNDIENVIFIPQAVVNNYLLRSGDLVEYKCAKTSASSAKYVYEIESINGERLNRIGYPVFDKIAVKLNKDAKKLCDNAKNDFLNAKCGSRNIICVKDMFSLGDIIAKIEVLKNNYHIVNLIVDALPEDIAGLPKDENIENFYTSIDESNKQCVQVINLAIERTKRLAEDGKRVVLLVSEAKKIIKHKNFSLNYEADAIRYRSLDLCHKVINLARILENNAQITTFLVLKMEKDVTELDKYLLSEFSSLACNFYDFY